MSTSIDLCVGQVIAKMMTVWQIRGEQPAQNTMMRILGAAIIMIRTLSNLEVPVVHVEEESKVRRNLLGMFAKMIIYASMVRTKNSLEKKIRCIRASRPRQEVDIRASHGRANPLISMTEEARLWP